MSQADTFSVHFWGVRGSIACSGPDVARYGGNTSCLEVRCGSMLFILDAGTGLRNLGRKLHGTAPIAADVFLTHTHMDHITGVPFFTPFFDPRNKFRLWSGHLQEDKNLHEVLSDYMVAPLFPVPPAVFNATLAFRDFKAGETLHPRAGVVVKTAPLQHPNNATGYRIEYGGRALCYVTDTEHVPGKPDQAILDLIQGADMMVYDSTYTDEEFPRYVHWGHSTWQEGIRLCEAANVKKLVIFHHDPSHDDDFMDRVAEQAEKMRPGTIVARDGLFLNL